METKSPQLKDGCEWADHEDCIIGDEEGLKNLIVACETALKEGEYYGSNLGDYTGVKKLDTQWFKDPMDSVSTRFANAILAVVLCCIGILILIGVGTVFKWFF